MSFHESNHLDSFNPHIDVLVLHPSTQQGPPDLLEVSMHLKTDEHHLGSETVPHQVSEGLKTPPRNKTHRGVRGRINQIDGILGVEFRLKKANFKPYF